MSPSDWKAQLPRNFCKSTDGIPAKRGANQIKCSSRFLSCSPQVFTLSIQVRYWVSLLGGGRPELTEVRFKSGVFINSLINPLGQNPGQKCLSGFGCCLIEGFLNKSESPPGVFLIPFCLSYLNTCSFNHPSNSCGMFLIIFFIGSLVGTHILASFVIIPTMEP